MDKKKLRKNRDRGIITQHEYTVMRLSEMRADRYERLLNIADRIPFLSDGFKWLIQGRCVCCGGRIEDTRYSDETRSRMIMDSLCFTCLFWTEKVEAGGFLNIEGRSYRVCDENSDRNPLMRGHGGASFTIELDGKIINTTNLWHQGVIPDHFIDKFKTAKFV